MATEFTATLKSSTGDYTSQNAAMAGVVAGAADLSLATIKVFGISTYTGTPTGALTGLTSGATGTLVLVNVARNQALIKAITGTFQSGETVQSSGGNSFVLTNAGDSPIIGIRCFGMVDTTPVASATCVTTATNKVRIYADATAVATMPYGTGYRLEITDSSPGINNAIKFISWERLSLKGISIADVTAWHLYEDGVAASGGQQLFLKCYFKGVMHAGNTAITKALSMAASGDLVCVNCIFEGWTTVGNTANAVCTGANAHSYYFENCTVYNCANGFGQIGGTFTTKNCLYDHAGLATHVGWTGTIGGTNNASSEATPPATNQRINQTFTYVNTGTGDFHLAAGDAGAKDFGADLSADATYAFADDFDGVARPQGTAWDIGATEVAVASNTFEADVLPDIRGRRRPRNVTVVL